jgi:RNA polymerase sigma factor (sigma-70 family)
MLLPDRTVADAPAGGSAFPGTRFSIVMATGSDDPLIREDAWSTLIHAYWKPVYKYVRIKWQATEADAQDLTQGFFTRAMEAGFFERFDPARARFRTYLRTCLHGFLSNEHKAAGRKKRGGDVRFVPLDFETAEGELRRAAVSPDVDPEEFFRRESIRSLFTDAVDRLRLHCEETGRTHYFELFRRYDLAEGERPSYRDLADAFDVPVTQVTNHLAYARRRFRQIVLENLRAVSGTEAEFRQEAMELLGVDPS